MKIKRCKEMACGCLDEETGFCSRYGRKLNLVRGCGIANKRFGKRPFTRRAADNGRKWWEEHRINEECK